ncbi:hypothetical protein HPB47_016130 [Ixodes persulcatus]|uniref:Uncharacterized protein n=1 Tax=Ixodes persulcatus TaxID=34615 RepID=A0AC60QTN9_IXOPE|nr:hypothetical protein HPB47_016130 [Ixodes persulcatus]
MMKTADRGSVKLLGTIHLARVILKVVGMGNLRMVYDDSCYGARIRVLSDDAAEGGGVPLCDTIVAVQTCLRTERLNAFWSAVDMSRNPHERRHFRVTFSSPQAVQEFDRAFTEMMDLVQSHPGRLSPGVWRGIVCGGVAIVACLALVGCRAHCRLCGSHAPTSKESPVHAGVTSRSSLFKKKDQAGRQSSEGSHYAAAVNAFSAYESDAQACHPHFL